jgi:hypothetical protein
VPVRILNQVYLFDYEALLLVLRFDVRFGFFNISVTESGIARCHAEGARKNKANASSHRNPPSLSSEVWLGES